ncbi:phosphoribosylanthranilate isomerase [Chlamydiota bacterium]
MIPNREIFEMQKPVKIKICGITNLEDALLAAEYGADAIGFVFYQKSPRYIPLEEAAVISRKMPPFVSRVGVFVDEPQEKIVEVAQLVGLDYFQFHGNESPSYCSFFGRRSIKAIRVSNKKDIDKVKQFRSIKNILFDSKAANSFGGTGIVFDWELLPSRNDFADTFIMLSGGLTPSNVTEAIIKVSPDAVDVSSSIEIEPGLKDHKKMRAFIETVKRFCFEK